MTADPALLRKAADIIHEGGLSKGLFSTDDGRHCTVGALLEAAYGETVWEEGRPDTSNPIVYEGAQALAQVVAPGNLATLLPIYNWNDALERTAEDVIDAFEQAAQQLEANR